MFNNIPLQVEATYYRQLRPVPSMRPNSPEEGLQVIAASFERAITKKDRAPLPPEIETVLRKPLPGFFDHLPVLGGLWRILASLPQNEMPDPRPYFPDLDPAWKERNFGYLFKSRLRLSHYMEAGALILESQWTVSGNKDRFFWQRAAAVFPTEAEGGQSIFFVSRLMDLTFYDMDQLTISLFHFDVPWTGDLDAIATRNWRPSSRVQRWEVQFVRKSKFITKTPVIFYRSNDASETRQDVLASVELRYERFLRVCNFYAV